MPSRRAPLVAVLVAVALLCAACGGGGGGEGGGSGDLAAEAAETVALMDRLEALPTSTTTIDQFTLELGQIRDALQQQIQDVAQADAPDELAPRREGLASRLRELRTQLGRVNAAALTGDLEAAQTIVGNLSSIGDVRNAAAAIEDAG